MTFTDLLLSIFEVALVLITIWAVFHEDRFVAFEERVISYFRRRKLKIARIEHGKKISTYNG